MSRPLRARIRLPRPVSRVASPGKSAEETPPPGPGETTAAQPAGPASGASGRTCPQAQAELDSARKALLAAGRELTQLQGRILADAEGQLLDLALQIAHKVLMQEIQTERYEIEPIVQEALSRVPAGQAVTVHLSPQDLARSGLSGAASDEGTRFVPDPTVPPACCRVEMDHGMIDSSPTHHLDEIAEVLRSGT